MIKSSFSRWCANPVWLLFFPLLLLLPGLSGFPFPPSAGSFSDLALAHYPSVLFLKRSLAELGRLPLWGSAILGGHPFYANPLSGMWYPPGWLALLLPLPFGLNLLAALHILWGGIGLYRFMRLEGLPPIPAVLGGLAFVGLPKLLAHFGAGHLTLIYAVSWTPWLVYAIFRHSAWIVEGNPSSGYLRALGWRAGWRQPGVVLGLIFLADVRWGAYAVLLMGFLLVFAPFWSPNRQHAVSHGLGSLLNRVLAWVSQAALGVMLAAPLLLPLLNFAHLSTRARMTSQDVFAYSLPPSGLLGLAVPGFGAFHEWVIYPGAVVLLLSLTAWLGAPNRAAVRRWTWLAALSLVLALGSGFPPLAFIGSLPGFSWLRVPPRCLFLFGLSLAALAAHGLAALDAGISPSRQRAIRLSWFAWTLISGGLGLAVALAVGRWSAVWGFMASLAACLCLFPMLRPASRQPVFRFGILLIVLLDIGVYNASLISFKSSQVVLGQSASAAVWLSEQPGLFRVYSPSYSLPQQTAALYRLQLTDGVDPLQLAAYADFMTHASGVASPGYSVTLPPYPGGDPRLANLSAIPDARRLGLLNVKYVVADFDLSVAGLVPVWQQGETRIYANQLAQERAWVQPIGMSLGQGAQPPLAVEWTPDEIQISARGPGLLVVSELAYPGWQAFVDGQRAALGAADGLFRTVSLEAGLHQIVMRFVPSDLYIGLGLLAAALAWVGLSQVSRRRLWISQADEPA